ncbi:hypothetical protein GGR57DRAFT_520263 [Xylariaceae sp. FL1272]|nr:hypothetical protein GGR57DRAFT_520263 [Xylariaceae sp. FL1272]
MPAAASSHLAGGFVKVQAGESGYTAKPPKWYLRSVVEAAQKKPLDPSTLNIPAPGHIEFRAGTHEDAIEWIHGAMQPLTTGQKVPKILSYTDASADCGNGGIGIETDRVDGEGISDLWNTPTSVRRSFAVKGKLDSADIETLGAYTVLREACKQVHNFTKSGSHSAKLSPWIIIAIDCLATVQYYQALYHGQSPGHLKIPAHYQAHMMEPLEWLLQAGCRISLVWIPGHVGIVGNEDADTLARVGRKFCQLIPNGVGYVSGESIFSLTEFLTDATLSHIDKALGSSVEYGGNVPFVFEPRFYNICVQEPKTAPRLQVLAQLKHWIDFAVAYGHLPITNKSLGQQLWEILQEAAFKAPVSNSTKKSVYTGISAKNTRKEATKRMHGRISDRNANKEARKQQKKQVRATRQLEEEDNKPEEPNEIEKEVMELENELKQLRQKLARLEAKLERRQEKHEEATMTSLYVAN